MLVPTDASIAGRPAPPRWPRHLAWAVVATWLLVLGPRASADSHTRGDVRVAHWTTAEGLPQNTINDIVALPNGELWLATFGGLVRFDGVGFTVVDIANSPGLASNRVTALVPAGADALWFVTQDGHLGRLERGRVTPLLSPAPAMQTVISLVRGRSGFYAQAANGTVWASDGTRPWRLEMQAPPGGSGGLNFLTSTRSGRVWASFETVLTEVSASAGTPVPLPAKGRGVSAGPGDDIWVGFDDRLARLSGGRLDTLDVRPALTAGVSVVLPVSEAQAWVSGDGVVSQLTAHPDGTWHREDLPLGLAPGLVIRALAVDSEGSLWIGTNGRGLYRADRHATQRFGEQSGIGAVAAVVPDDTGGAWVSSICNGIFHIDDAGGVEHVYHSGFTTQSNPGGCEHAFAPAPGGRLWLRWEAHLFRVERAPTRITPMPVSLPADTGPVLARPDGTLWVISRGGDVRRVSGDRVLERHTLPAPLISAALAPDGALWVGGSATIHEVRGTTVRTFDQTHGVPRGAVRDLLITAAGDVWIATYGGGLGVLHGGIVTRITTAAGLPDNGISRLLDDGRGRVWMATNRGMAVVERRAVEAFIASPQRALAPVVFGAERGVPEANFGLPAGAVDTRGRVWVGTIDGVVRIDAAGFPFNPVAPLIRIDSVLADERELPIGPVVEIPPGTARVRLNFSAAALLYPERMRYRFRIEGIDRDWVDVGPQRFATFTPSGPGRHRFLLQARNEDGVWNVAPAALELAILPAWWQTRTARLAGLALVALLAFGLYRQRVGALERRHAERVKIFEDRRRADEQAADLRRQLEHVSRVALAGELAASLAHEVKQPLTAIVANAEAAQHVVAAGPAPDPDVREMLQDIVAQGLRASEVITGLREFLRSGTPDDRPIDMSALVREMLPLVRRELEDHRIRVELVLSNDLGMVRGRRVQLGQVVVNLLMNACEAMASQDAPRQVNVTTRQQGDRVDLAVTDSGPGLSPEIADKLFEPFVTTKPEGMGMGLAICRSIADAHRGRLTADAAPGGGLRVTLSLPADGRHDAEPPFDSRA
ncbi:ATP-binding protein [Luteitalea sp.]|jgi:signal transduction histidine kinase/ligand-binding sensor domain-containing protein|uniref:sensor histidine kinase n=1 Tax=Luteitalea sp. TaxID=2004800 RepID=UPI0037CC3993